MQGVIITFMIIWKGSNANSVEVVELAGHSSVQTLNDFPNLRQFAGPKLTHYALKPQRPSVS